MQIGREDGYTTRREFDEVPEKLECGGFQQMFWTMQMVAALK
ncbi:hypothetical protein AVEN_19229-1, partial [Araneus ventricosus]